MTHTHDSSTVDWTALMALLGLVSLAVLGAVL